MRTVRGIAVMAAAALAVVALLAAPALAKGPGEEGSPVRSAVIFGPNGSRPASLGTEQAMDLAMDNGVLRAATEYAIDLRAFVPPSGPALGPRYEVTYVLTSSFAESARLDGTTVTQEIYPFAVGGPWAFTASGQRLHASGWWPVSPDAVQILKSAGVLTSTASTRATPAGSPAAPRAAAPALWLALGLVALIVLIDTLVARGEKLATRA